MAVALTRSDRLRRCSPPPSSIAGMSFGRTIHPSRKVPEMIPGTLKLSLIICHPFVGYGIIIVPVQFCKQILRVSGIIPLKLNRYFNGNLFTAKISRENDFRLDLSAV